jgi:copper(I)-binding protein
MSKSLASPILRSIKAAVGLAVAACLLVGPASPSIAADKMVGKIHVIQPWSRATPKGARVGGGYMTIRNMGNTADRLVAVTSAIAGRVEIHEMKMDKGIMRMRPLAKGLEIPPGKSVELKPGGYHIMFLDLKKPITEGGVFMATIAFEKAGEVQIEFVGKSIGAKSNGMHGHKGHMKHSTN